MSLLHLTLAELCENNGDLNGRNLGDAIEFQFERTWGELASALEYRQQFS